MVVGVDDVILAVTRAVEVGRHGGGELFHARRCGLEKLILSAAYYSRGFDIYEGGETKAPDPLPSEPPL